MATIHYINALYNVEYILLEPLAVQPLQLRHSTAVR